MVQAWAHINPSSSGRITTEGWSKGLCFNCHIQNHAFEFIRTKLARQRSSFIPRLFLPHLPLVVFCSGGILYLELLEDPLLSGSCDAHAVIVFPKAAAGWHLTIYRLMFRENLAPEFVALFPLSSLWSPRFYSGQSQPLHFLESCPTALSAMLP